MNKWNQQFNEEEANLLYHSCSCTELDGAGDCDWCEIYYEEKEETEK